MDDSGESMEPMEEVPLKGLGESVRTEEISAWLIERSWELIYRSTLPVTY